MGCGKATILVWACGFKPVRNIWCELFMLHPFLGIGALYLFVNKHEPPPPPSLPDAGFLLSAGRRQNSPAEKEAITGWILAGEHTVIQPKLAE